MKEITPELIHAVSEAGKKKIIFHVYPDHPPSGGGPPVNENEIHILLNPDEIEKLVYNLLVTNTHQVFHLPKPAGGNGTE